MENKKKARHIRMAKFFIIFYPGIFIMLCFFLSCKRVDTSKLTNLNNNTISVLGHRGCGVLPDNTYPINTLESIGVGIDQMGADGMEIDAQLSKDNQLILYHDQELMTMTFCNGMVNSHTKDELCHCTISSVFFNDPLKNYHLVPLEEVFEKYKNYAPSPICYIDVKPYYDSTNFLTYADYNQVFAQTMTILISKYDKLETTILSSVDNNMLLQLKSTSPSLKLAIDNPDFETAFQHATSMGLFGITINYKNINRVQMDKAHANNLRVILWGVDTKAACRATALLLPDYVETDNVLYMLSLTK